MSDQDLSGARPRIVDLLDTQNVRATELAKQHGFHAIDLRVRGLSGQVFMSDFRNHVKRDRALGGGCRSIDRLRMSDI